MRCLLRLAFDLPTHQASGQLSVAREREKGTSTRSIKGSSVRRQHRLVLGRDSGRQTSRGDGERAALAWQYAHGQQEWSRAHLRSLDTSTRQSSCRRRQAPRGGGEVALHGDEATWALVARYASPLWRPMHLYAKTLRGFCSAALGAAPHEHAA